MTEEEIRRSLIVALANFVMECEMTLTEERHAWELLFDLHGKYSHEQIRQRLREQAGSKK